jgi:hypothetical protein
LKRRVEATVEREEFATSEWWLTSTEVSSGLIDARSQIADQQGWDRASWFSDPDKLQELCTILESGGDYLLVQLDSAGDEAAQLQWLQDVLSFLPPAGSPAQDDASRGERAAPAPWEGGAAGGAAGPQSASEERAETGDGGQATGAGDGESGGGEAPAEEVSGTWNAQWGMFLRFQNGNYEYALSTVLMDGPGVDTPEGQPDGTWHPDQETAAAARNEAEGHKRDLAAIFDEHGLEPAQLQKILHDPALETSLGAMEEDLADLFGA